MHELSVILQIVDRIKVVAKENELTQIETLVLQIGELTSMIPRYVEACYPAAVDGTILEDTELVIEILPGNGRCKQCGATYNLIKNHNTCPSCASTEFMVVSGKEFNIKEIVGC